MGTSTKVKAGSWWLLAPGERFLFLKQIYNCQISLVHWKKMQGWKLCMQQSIRPAPSTAASDNDGETASCGWQSCCLREICCFWVALIWDVMEGLPRCVSPSDYLTLQLFHLSTNVYSKAMTGAYWAWLSGFWNEGQGHRKPGGFSVICNTLPLTTTQQLVSCIADVDSRNLGFMTMRLPW